MRRPMVFAGLTLVRLAVGGARTGYRVNQPPCQRPRVQERLVQWRAHDAMVPHLAIYIIICSSEDVTALLLEQFAVWETLLGGVAGSSFDQAKAIPCTVPRRGMLLGTTVGLEVAMRHSVTVHDGLYLTVATGSGCRLITAGCRLREACSEKPILQPVEWAGEIP